MNDLIEIFKTGQLVVVCKTEEDYNKFMELCFKNNITWHGRAKVDYSDYYNCVRFDGSHLLKGSYHFYKVEMPYYQFFKINCAGGNYEE